MLCRAVAARIKPQLRRSLNTNSLLKSKHSDVPTFLAYAELLGLSPKSPVYRGTLYEYTVRDALFTKNMELDRCGGRDDKGIDLRGIWHIPTSAPFAHLLPKIASNSESLPASSEDQQQAIPVPSSSQPKPQLQTPLPQPPLQAIPTTPLPVLVQCKLSIKTAPCVIRELNGTHNSVPHTNPPTIAILTTPTPATRGITSALNLARRPLAYLCITDQGTVRQFVWNSIVSDIIGTGVSVSLLHRPPPVDDVEEQLDEDAGTIDAMRLPQKEVVLTFNGRVVDGILFARKKEAQILKLARLKEEKAERKRINAEKRAKELALPPEERLALEQKRARAKIRRMIRQEEKSKLEDLAKEAVRRTEERKMSLRAEREEKKRQVEAQAKAQAAEEERKKEEKRLLRRRRREEKLAREKLDLAQPAAGEGDEENLKMTLE